MFLLYLQKFLRQRAAAESLITQSAELVASDMDFDVATVNRTTVTHSWLRVSDTASSYESGDEMRS